MKESSIIILFIVGLSVLSYSVGNKEGKDQGRAITSSSSSTSAEAVQE